MSKKFKRLIPNHGATIEYYKALYLDWFNNFITVERFAEYYEMPVKKARRIINKGFTLHHDAFGHH